MKASAKTQKRAKKQSTYKKTWFIVTSIVCLLVIVYIVLNISAILINQHQDNLDKQKFAQVETLVNGVKAELDQKVPQGEWYINKYCDEANVTFGPGEITCFYGVESRANLDQNRVITILDANHQLSNVGVFSDETAKNISYKTEITSVACGYRYSNENSYLYCSSGARTLLYQLIDR